MKISDMPQWVQKYRKPGYTIRRNGNGYALYKVTSHRVPGLSYPKVEQEYIGVIDQEKGLIAKKVYPESVSNYFEYGLSHVIYFSFKRELMRSYYQANDTFIKVGILYYIYRTLDAKTLSLSSLCTKEVGELANKLKPSRFKAMVNKIDELLVNIIKDENEIIFLKNALLLVVVKREQNKGVFSEELKSLMKGYGLKYE